MFASAKGIRFLGSDRGKGFATYILPIPINSINFFCRLPDADPGKFIHVDFQEVQRSNDMVPSVVYVLDVSTSMVRVKCGD